MKMCSKKGFSLVELSIVLVILGLLTGGILAGQSLIRAAELRAVPTEFNKYITAMYSFRDKYFSIPGDMSEATKFWGFSGTTNAPACVSNSGITTESLSGTCDGNGDGALAISTAGAATGERFQFWRQLALAGLLEGEYTGLAGTLSANHAVPGINGPQSKMRNAGYSIANSSGGVSAVYYNLNYGNFIVFGAATTNALTVNPVLKPEEAWNIDTKIDDGKPASGKIIALYWDTACGIPNSAPNDGSNLDASYYLANPAVACALYWRKLLSM